MKDKRSRILEYIKSKNNESIMPRATNFSIEVLDNREMLLRGCKRILKYTEQQIILSTKVFDILVGGEDLRCATYHIDGVEIDGDIREIKFVLRGDL